MNFYFIKTPKFIRSFYKEYIWHIKGDKKEIYLTFDDGPTDKITDFVLDTLKKYQAKATFFCIGKNINQLPNIYQRIIDEGHSVGNHTQNHENGWRTENNTYLQSVKNCKNVAETFLKTKKEEDKLFRPPYGKIKRSQAKKIILQGYKIIMWSVLSGDFDATISKEKCLQNVIKNTKKGDVLVFHDSEKAFVKMKYVLPKVLAHFTKKGYVFKAI